MPYFIIDIFIIIYFESYIKHIGKVIYFIIFHKAIQVMLRCDEYLCNNINLKY